MKNMKYETAIKIDLFHEFHECSIKDSRPLHNSVSERPPEYTLIYFGKINSRNGNKQPLLDYCRMSVQDTSYQFYILCTYSEGSMVSF